MEGYRCKACESGEIKEICFVDLGKSFYKCIECDELFTDISKLEETKEHKVKDMYVYIASSFKLKDRIERIAQRLWTEGFGITREWWHKDYKEIDLPDDEWYEHESVIQVCQDNFEAIDMADIVILVCPEDESKKFNGANIEIGYAIAKDKPVVSVGALGRSGMYQPLIKTDTIDELVSVVYDEVL